MLLNQEQAIILCSYPKYLRSFNFPCKNYPEKLLSQPDADCSWRLLWKPGRICLGRQSYALFETRRRQSSDLHQAVQLQRRDSSSTSTLSTRRLPNRHHNSQPHRLSDRDRYSQIPPSFKLDWLTIKTTNRILLFCNYPYLLPSSHHLLSLESQPRRLSLNR